MADLKPTAPSLKAPVDPAKLVGVLNKSSAVNRKIDVRVFGLDDDAGEFFKVASFGAPGTGKTRAIAGFLEAGERPFVLNTDLGGNGLGTVKRYLQNKGKADLLRNIQFADFSTYDAFQAFLENPLSVVPGLWYFDPSMLIWEGGSFWQTTLLDDKILSLPAVAKDGISNIELRNEGMFATQPDWNAMRRMTIRTLNKFLTVHSPTRLLHKYVTFQEDEPKRDDQGAVKPGQKKRPLLYTAANTLAAAGFDLILQLEAITPIGKKETEYIYRTAGNAGVQAKNREFPIKPEEPADMFILWQKITGKTVI